MELLFPSAKRRRSEDLAAGEPPPRATEATEAANLEPTTHSKQPPPPPSDAGGGGGDDGVDRISGLPDAVLGEIVSLLSTKEAGRTQILSSRWRHVWLASPLVLDANDLYTKPKDDTHPMDLVSAVSRILSAHPGPGRRFCIPLNYLHDRRATVDAWLSSPTLHNLQELEFLEGKYMLHRYRRLYPLAHPPASAFRFSATLRVATFSECEILDSSVEGIHFPTSSSSALKMSASPRAHCKPSFPAALSWSACCLKKSLGLAVSGLVPIASGASLWVLIPLGTNPTYVGSNPTRNEPHLQEVIIVDAPCLERFLCFGAEARSFKTIYLTVISAPKLKALGCLKDKDDGFDHPRLVFGTTAIQGFKVVRLTTTMSNVKTLAVASDHINLDMVIELMKCFPCLETLYIKSCISGNLNPWRCKHRDFIKSFDIRLKTIVLQQYRGSRSQVNFASFFLLNARMLESMILEVEASDYSKAFLTEQYGMLQMEKTVSRGARLTFTRQIHRIHVDHVRDLSIRDPLECRWWNWSRSFPLVLPVAFGICWNNYFSCL